MNPRHESHRPQFHFSPARNWINDPNGLVWFEGEYHLFFQYNPYGSQWGHMSWGHAVSTDLVNWHELPVAIAEDERVSIYSGSVVVDTRNTSGFGNGRTPPLVAIYTGCLRVHEGGQAQELAYSTDRGRTWTKYAGNPVLDLGLRDFRDPKVFWHEATSRWVMVVVVPDERTAKFYVSADLKRWQWLSDFSAPFEGEGIWECPDLIPMQAEGATVWMFKVDVFGGHPSGGTGARIFFGDFDGTRYVAEPETAPQWADHGADFYAALSWANLPGAPQRPLWLAWMSCHRYAKQVPTQPWRGAMSVPRELALQRGTNGRWLLLQQPVAALQTLRGPLTEQATQTVNDGELALLPPATDTRAVEVRLQVQACSAGECGLVLHADGAAGTRIGYDASRGTVFVDRSRSGWCPPGDALYPRRREVPVAAPEPGRPLRLHVLVDWSSVEVFVGDGEAVLTEQVFPADSARGLRLYAAAGRADFAAVQVWPLRPARFT